MFSVEKESSQARWTVCVVGARPERASNLQQVKFLQFINNQLVGDQNISRRDVFNTVAAGVERKYGVRYQVVSPEEAEQIDYLKDMEAFFDGRNYGTWDEKNGVVYFNEEMFNDRKTALRELRHETGAVIIASMYEARTTSLVQITTA